MSENVFDRLLNLVGSLETECPTMHEVKEIAALLKREQRRYDFKLVRTIEDKKIITNMLNKTIQELEEKQKALTEQKHQIEEQSKFKEELFASVSHELRTPLHGILGMARLLSQSVLESENRNYVDVIYHSADNLMVIINDILSLSKLNAGNLALSAEPFSTEQIFTDLEGILSEKASEKNIKLVQMIAPDLPKWLIGDPTRLLQILLNLLNNSVKFTKEGYVCLSANTVKTLDDKTFIEFEIKDTGIGIPDEKIEKIFESFTQVHDAKAYLYEGAGLGLNIVRNLLDLMNGSIEVTSTVNKGSIFKLQIPFQVPDKELVERFTVSNSESEFPCEWLKKKFILIEDNPANILFTERTFEKWGVKIAVAEDLENAKSMLEQQQYDCILSDVILPDGNGLDFIALLRKDRCNPNQHTPIVVLTASANKIEAKLTNKLQITSYLSKPFRMERLLGELEKVFNHSIEIPSKAPQSSKPPTVLNIEKRQEEQQKELAAPEAPKKSGMESLIEELYEILVDQLDEILPLIDNVIQSKEWEALRFQAHRIKSTANIVKEERIAHFAKEIENAVDAGVIGDAIVPLLNGFKLAGEKCEAYTEYLADNKIQKRA